MMFWIIETYGSFHYCESSNQSIALAGTLKWFLIKYGPLQTEVVDPDQYKKIFIDFDARSSA